MMRRCVAVIGVLPVVLTCGLSVVLAATRKAPDESEDLLRFGSEMAEKGNWREARFQWEIAWRSKPDDPRLLNNLAAAAEVLGEPERASDLYRRALELSGEDPVIRDNAARALRFWKPAGGNSSPTGRGAGDARVPKHGRGKTVRVQVRLPLPARLELPESRRTLVASFLVEGDPPIDANREIVRFIRSEFRKKTSLEVLEVTPPPAVPEQAVEDLAANYEFWSWLGREHRADMIVSGVLRFSRTDVSGFQDEDVISPVTAQKVRRTRFVEQERFMFDLEIFFLRGDSGDLVHRDRYQRSSTYRGLSNDALSAFFQLAETIAGDVTSAVSPRTVDDFRVLFRG